MNDEDLKRLATLTAETEVIFWPHRIQREKNLDHDLAAILQRRRAYLEGGLDWLLAARVANGRPVIWPYGGSNPPILSESTAGRPSEAEYYCGGSMLAVPFAG